ncbi:hypothetical protein [Methyloraptor flagellatus]|uniref:DUF1640 domain-containing protein n=1 Tax=Methyloraptor flagellatus TaxID=3162530 RepID=A0AAU7XCM2_9HYPH
MGDVVDFNLPGEAKRGNIGGGGPEDPMLETRVENLERDMKDIRSTLHKSELLLIEIKAHLVNCATKDEVAKLREDVIDVRARIATKDDVAALRGDISNVRQDTAELKGRFDGLDKRFAYLPSTWQMITFMVTSQIALAGLLFVAVKFGLK